MLYPVNTKEPYMKLRNLTLTTLLLNALVACGGGGSGGGSGGDGSNSAPAPSPALSGFSFQQYQAPALSNISCNSTANASAAIQRVQFAQTVLLETKHPFFYLSAERDTAIRVSVTGNGKAPEVRVTAKVDGKEVGSVCLGGPSTLAASVDDSVPSLATSFVGNIPAAWVVPGLQLLVQAGGASQTISSSELKIGPAPVLSFVTMDWLLWGDTQATPLPANFGKEYAARLPLTAINHSAFPLTVSMNQLPIGPRGDGRSSNGTTIKSPALIADRTPACSASQATAGTCVQWSGFAVLSSVRLLTGTIQGANGLGSATHWYGALGLKSRVGGGLAGGNVGSGDDYGLTFNHEFGHAFDQPHWGDNLYSRAAANADSIHPYSGQYVRADGQANGGGFGNSWAFDPLQANPFLNPVCALTGKERQEPMQRNGDACVPAGETFDFASDYSAMFVARYFNGASQSYSGNVASPRDQTGNANPKFLFKTTGGRDNFKPGTNAKPSTFQRWDSTSARYVDKPQDTMTAQMNYPQQWDVPVYTLWGAFSNTNPEVTTILAPLKYRGGLPRVVDPTNATDFAAIKANATLFWWGADFVVRADFDDGTRTHALILQSARGTDPLSGDSFVYWGVNIPVKPNAKLVSVSLFNRPMEVRYSDGGNTSSPWYAKTNLNSTLNASLTADRYLDGLQPVKTLRLQTGM